MQVPSRFRPIGNLAHRALEIASRRTLDLNRTWRDRKGWKALCYPVPDPLGYVQVRQTERITNADMVELVINELPVTVRKAHCWRSPVIVQWSLMV
jgi:hypothetical protein